MAKLESPSACIKADPKQIAKVVLFPGDPLRAKTVAETYLEKNNSDIKSEVFADRQFATWGMAPGNWENYEALDMVQHGWDESEGALYFCADDVSTFENFLEFCRKTLLQDTARAAMAAMRIVAL